MFYTPVEIPDYPFRITYKDTLFWIGSCFTSNIGDAMKELKFHCEINPFGTLYNPISILNGLNLIIQKKILSEKNLFNKNELWNSFLFHSSFSDTDKTAALEKMNSQLYEATEKFYNCKYLIITFGTAYVFRYKHTNEIVSNCHKIPSKEFEHICLSVTEISTEYYKFIENTISQFPDLKILFSVSPIRHFKDGAHNNQISKSILLLAINDIINNYPDKCFYFPSYEIVLDELRDYRFYAKDMCHLSETAIGHIKEIFIKSLIDTESQNIIKEIQKLNLSKNHRPFNTNTVAYKKFTESIVKKEEELKKLYPHLSW